MHPFSRALTRFHAGHRDATFTIRRDDGFQQVVPAAPFFDSESFPLLEQRALGECRGRVLDLGCAAGRHSLELLRRGLEVTSLDILPEMEAILRDRGVTDVVIADGMTFSGPRFDTLLMLMNGIGMAGTLDGLRRFLHHAHALILPRGRILCDSIDVGVTHDPRHIAYREANVAAGRPPGQQAFVMEGRDADPRAFAWLHLDFASLARCAEVTGWEAVLLESEADSGHYLCKLTESPDHPQTPRAQKSEVGASLLLIPPTPTLTQRRVEGRSDSE